MTTPILLEQCWTGSCCIEFLDDIVLNEMPPREPRGVYIDMSSSLSENRLKHNKKRVLN
jgi:hypothetical protein